MDETTCRKAIFYVFISCILCIAYAQHPDGMVMLKQGAVIGLKIMTRTAVYSYLGIPYAQSPTGNLRFAAPKRHSGWGNRTLPARDYKPICPQLTNYMFDETHNGYAPHAIKTDEDCLYVNVWSPQSALRGGNHSVLVIITGEEQAFDWAQNRPTGLDLAAEGIVVVTIQSRTNIFGWLSLRSPEAPGNLGLLDQQMAFEWIEENIHKFGGDPKQVTLLGHGTSGAPNAMLHLTNPKTATLFARMIVMSGTIYSSWSYQNVDASNNLTTGNDLSWAIVKKLACSSSHIKYILDCLRQKSVTDLLKAFEHIYEHGNYTKLLGPQIDTYLPKSIQYLSTDPKTVLELGDYPNIPILIGITSNEGAFIQELWLELAREGYEPLKKYITSSLLPNVLSHYGFENGATDQVRRMISWRFFDRIPQTPSYLLNAMQRLISETKYETPFLETIERLTSNHTLNTSIAMNDTVAIESAVQRRAQKTFYVYSFHHSKSIDIRGATNYFGGAGHTSDLLFLMGPSLFQQISRRKLTSLEMRLCLRMRHLFSEFIKMGNPTPGRIFDAWRPYTSKQKFVQILGETSLTTGSDMSDIPSSTIAENGMFTADLEKNSVEIENMIHGQARVVSSNILNPYRIGKENQPQNPTDSARMSKSYLGVYETSEYFNALTKINSFWMDLLPEMSTYYDLRLFNYTNGIFSRADFDDDPLFIAMAAANGSKFKHAFFSMLILVCLLLAVLCICVYILKKNQRNIDTSFL